MYVTVLDIVSHLLDVLFLCLFSFLSLCVSVWVTFSDPPRVDSFLSRERVTHEPIQGILYYCIFKNFYNST